MKAFGANPGPAALCRLHLQAGDDRSGRPAGRQPVVFGNADAGRCDQGTVARPHRLRRDNLEEFVKGLEARGIKIDAPIRQVPNTKLKVAFLSDPWGTYIELTEGLAP